MLLLRHCTIYYEHKLKNVILTLKINKLPCHDGSCHDF